MEDIGKILKNFRIKNKITGQTLAELLDCSHQFIYLLENNKKKISVEKLEKLKKIMSESEYITLKQAIDLNESPEDIKKELLELKEIKYIEQKKIPFYSDIQASAGYGCYNSEGVSEYLEVPAEFAKKHNIAITVIGDSMEPEIQSGDIIIVDTSQVEYLENKIVVVNYKDATYLKKLIRDQEDNLYLFSINPYYPKIFIEDESELKIVGKLISVIRKY